MIFKFSSSLVQMQIFFYFIGFTYRKSVIDKALIYTTRKWSTM